MSKYKVVKNKLSMDITSLVAVSSITKVEPNKPSKSFSSQCDSNDSTSKGVDILRLSSKSDKNEGLVKNLGRVPFSSDLRQEKLSLEEVKVSYELGEYTFNLEKLAEKLLFVI